MKDYRIELRIKNNYLISAMESRGICTIKDLSELSSVNSDTICKYLRLVLSPYKTNGEFKKSAEKLSIALNFKVEKLFPENCIVKKNKLDILLDAEEMKETYIDNKNDRTVSTERICLVLGTLLEREEDVIKKRFGIDSDIMTLEQIGKDWGVGKDRIRQIEARALKKLRHNIRSRAIEEFYAEDDEQEKMIVNEA